MIKVEKFKMSHLLNFESDGEIIDKERSMLENDMNPKVDMVALLNESKEVVAFAGVNHLRTGVGEVWIIRGELIPEHRFEFYKTIVGLVDFCQIVMGLHRIELAIDCSWRDGGKWAQSLGFKFESIARDYDYLFQDHAIYTKIKRGL